MKNVVIIGRPNVGKSTLYNRLVGKREALVDDQPGVTRDRRIGTVEFCDFVFSLSDTPGLEEAAQGSLENLMTEKSLQALREADVILFVIDALVGLTPEDEYFARIVRKSGRPAILIANKAESKKALSGLFDSFHLGYGEPVAISAEHGQGMGELFEALLPHLGEIEETFIDEEKEKPIRVAIIGRPNVGKSTLVNALLGEERQLTGPYAGMTRDAILIPHTYKGRELELVDTAGMRRKARVEERLESMSVKESTTAIKYAEVVVLVLDATQPLEKQDNNIASLIEREGRACIVALNKWDLVQDKKTLMKQIEHRLTDVMPKMAGISVIPISALKKESLPKMLDAVLQTHKLWNTRIGTSAINRWLEDALSTHTAPMVRGRRFKVRYMTQIKARPPTFVLFVNNTEDAPESYIRYLSNSLREHFKLPGVPLRLQLKSGKNPYEGKAKRS